MDEIAVSATISRPPEEVFEYLVDIANHAEFTDHFMVDWHLLREDSRGLGAGARFRIKAPFSRFSWADMTIVELQPPHRIVEHGRGGKFNRIRMLGVYTLSPGPHASTTVRYTFESETKLPSDRLIDAIARGWTKRQLSRAMRRLRRILEEDRDRGARASIAAR
jgi:uncharacterized protein YndB with AHSA1/START domain